VQTYNKSVILFVQVPVWVHFFRNKQCKGTVADTRTNSHLWRVLKGLEIIGHVKELCVTSYCPVVISKLSKLNYPLQLALPEHKQPQPTTRMIGDHASRLFNHMSDHYWQLSIKRMTSNHVPFCHNS
jgi:hypothetical protein